MGIVRSTAMPIIRAHKHLPMRGDLLLCGRQSMFMTPDEAAELICSLGLTPQITPEDCELDWETRLLGEGDERRGGEAITDESFFRMLGAGRLTILDHSNYEGATLLIDLNNPIPSDLEAKFDFIVDGGTLDNVFNPAQALMNISRMLRPEGRIFTYNIYSGNRYFPYSMLPHQWYLDYFSINRYRYAQCYFGLHLPTSQKHYYQISLRKRASSRQRSDNFPIIDASMDVGTMVYAIKAPDSTWNRQPSQEFYRSEAEWREMEPIFRRFAEYPYHEPLVRSTSASGYEILAHDDFEYVDVHGIAARHVARRRSKRLFRLPRFLRSIKP
jgi:hypothetical protein